MKHKLRATVIIEYEADTEDYGTDDVTEMASIDKDNLLYQDAIMIGDNWFYGNEIVKLEVKPI